jgi:hypothetical protein
VGPRGRAVIRGAGQSVCRWVNRSRPSHIFQDAHAVGPFVRPLTFGQAHVIHQMLESQEPLPRVVPATSAGEVMRRSSIISIMLVAALAVPFGALPAAAATAGPRPITRTPAAPTDIVVRPVPERGRHRGGGAEREHHPFPSRRLPDARTPSQGRHAFHRRSGCGPQGLQGAHRLGCEREPLVCRRPDAGLGRPDPG